MYFVLDKGDTDRFCESNRKYLRGWFDKCNEFLNAVSLIVGALFDSLT